MSVKIQKGLVSYVWNLFVKRLRQPDNFITKPKYQTFSGTDNRAGHSGARCPADRLEAGTVPGSPLSQAGILGWNFRDAEEHQLCSLRRQVSPVVEARGGGYRHPYLTTVGKVNKEQQPGQGGSQG